MKFLHLLFTVLLGAMMLLTFVEAMPRTTLPPNCYQPVCGPCPEGAQCFCAPGTPLGPVICN